MAILKLGTAPSSKPKASRQVSSHSHQRGDSVWKISLHRVFPNIGFNVTSHPSPPSGSPVHTSFRERSLSADFDISHFYGDSSSPPGRTSPQRVRALKFSMASSMPLIPLSFARDRPDIRRRNEGFEVADDAIPFAIGTQTLIPLREALTRDDIRRRMEGFELSEERRSRRRDGLYLGDNSGISAFGTPEPIPVSDVVQTADASMCLSSATTVPSIYSSASWLGIDVESLVGSHDGMETHSVSVLFDADLNPSQSVVGNASDGVQRLYDILMDLSSSSFNEESFLRMAASLEW